MKIKTTKQINQQRQFLSLTVITVLFLLAAFGSTFAQGKLGKKYGSRNPQPCKKVASPGNTNAAAVKKKPVVRQDNKQTVTTAKTDPADSKDENGFPKPDFSALEKWYQIIRYEYKPIEKKLYIYFKTDVAYRERPSVFKMEYRNKDGMLMLDTTLSWMMGFPNAEVGEPTKGYVNMPDESTIKEVVTVKAVRVVE